MQALVVKKYGKADGLAIMEGPEPKAGKGEVLVKVRAVGLNPVDGYILSGNYALRPEPPFIPCFDGSGVVMSVGPGVGKWRSGDEVFFLLPSPGAAAGVVSVPEHALAALPAGLSTVAGAALGIPYVTAAAALFGRGKRQDGEQILVHGATGAVGHAALEWLRYRNRREGIRNRIMASAGSQEGLEKLIKMPDVSVLDHRETNHLEKALEISGRKGVDLALEMNAHIYLGKILPVLAPHGRVVIIGSQGTTLMNPRDLMVRQAAVLGFSLFQVREQMRKKILDEIASTPAGTWDPPIAETFPLSQAGNAFSSLLQGPRRGKIVLEF